MKAVIYITNSEVTLPQNVERAVVLDIDDEASVRKALDFMMFGLPKSVTEMPNKVPATRFVPTPDPADPGPEELEQFKAAEAGKQAEGAPPKSSLVIAAGSERVKPR